MNDFELVEKLRDYTKRLQKATKKKEKSDLLYLAAKDEDLQRFLKFLLDPHVVTGLSDKKIRQHYPFNGRTIEHFADACGYLQLHNTGRGEDIAVINHYIDRFNAVDTDFLRRVFTKNLPIGVDVKTVNKAIGFTLIPDWQVQQAYLIEKYPVKQGEWIAISQKMNGCHCSFLRGEMISRQGTQFVGLDHIINEIYSVVENADTWFFDGELIRKNTDGISDNDNFKLGTGIANSKDADKTCLEYVIYDMMPAAEFDAGQSKLNYRERLYQMNALDDLIRMKGCNHIRIVPRMYNGFDLAMIPKMLDYAVKRDWEGVMCNKNVPYRCTRHNGILKVKRFYTMDLPIIAVEEGTNRLTGTLGALVVDYKGNEVRIGSGFDDATRRKVWANRDMYMGSLLSVNIKKSHPTKRPGRKVCSSQPLNSSVLIRMM